MVKFLEQSDFVDTYGGLFKQLTPIQRRFLQLLPYNVTIGKTLAACGFKSIGNHSKWMATSPIYRECFEAVKELVTQAMEEEALRRGVHGVEEDIFYQGEVCGTKKVYSNDLLMFMLRARRPDVYRDRSSIDMTSPPVPAENSPFRDLSVGAKISIKQIIEKERQKNLTLEMQTHSQQQEVPQESSAS